MDKIEYLVALQPRGALSSLSADGGPAEAVAADEALGAGHERGDALAAVVLALAGGRAHLAAAARLAAGVVLAAEVAAHLAAALAAAAAAVRAAALATHLKAKVKGQSPRFRGNLIT